MRSLAIPALLISISAGAADAGKMFFTDRGANLVRVANLDGSDLQTLIPAAGSNVRGIATDLDSDDLFYADNGTDIIYRSRLDGSARVAIISADLGFPADLALDQDSGKLYWCDRDKNRIERANYDGSGRETLIATNQPYFLDLDRTNRKVYWGDYSGGHIFRADLPGGANEETVVSGLIQTRGVKVDPGGGYFYWCDRQSHKVQRRRIEGGPVEDLYVGLDTPHGMTLDIPAGKVYWADTGTNNIGGTGAKAINRGDMDGSGPQEILAEVSQPWDITLDTRVTTYPEWVARRFHKNAPPSISGPGADPDSDHHQNLLEYFADLDPLTAGPPQPSGYLLDGGGLLFHHRQTLEPITDVLATVEVSADLWAWNSAPGSSELISSSLGDGVQILVHKPGASSVDPRGTYMRLKLELGGR